MASSGFYAVCCTDECEAVWRRLEWELAAPSAAPARIAEVVSSLPSATVDAPRNLSAALLTRLEEIAVFHGGHVPLHGRLFVQWLHHAYPRECPFPHVSGTTSPMMQDEFIEVYGLEALDATMEEVHRHHNAINQGVLTSGGSAEALPWTAVEELIAEDRLKTRPGLTDYVSMRGFMVAAALVSFAVPLARATSGAATDRSSKVEKYLV
jgi:diadenosine tetraphosphatase ApaH/serine/threonine PP2A family protein phosphatase